jgi:hypothetical protein
MGAGGAYASLQAPGLPVQGLFAARCALSEASHSLCASQLDNALGSILQTSPRLRAANARARTPALLKGLASL